MRCFSDSGVCASPLRPPSAEADSELAKEGGGGAGWRPRVCGRWWMRETERSRARGSTRLGAGR
eukprot:5546988-Alexandrium_andersonii.AAC.1